MYFLSVVYVHDTYNTHTSMFTYKYRTAMYKRTDRRAYYLRFPEDRIPNDFVFHQKSMYVV